MKCFMIVATLVLLYIALTVLLHASVASVQNDTMNMYKVAFEATHEVKPRCERTTLLNANCK